RARLPLRHHALRRREGLGHRAGGPAVRGRGADRDAHGGDPAVTYSQLFRLDGRRAVVVGAGSGIGREAARALAAHGADVVCADRDLDAARATGVSTAYSLDVLDREAVRRAAG